MTLLPIRRSQGAIARFRPARAARRRAVHRAHRHGCAEPREHRADPVDRYRRRLVTGNLAFKQASIDRGRPQHRAGGSLALGRHAGQNRRSCRPELLLLRPERCGNGCIAPSAAIPERPDAVTTVAKFTAAGLSTALVPTDTAGNKVYYVVERMCLGPGRCDQQSTAIFPRAPWAPIRARSTTLA